MSSFEELLPSDITLLIVDELTAEQQAVNNDMQFYMQSLIRRYSRSAVIPLLKQCAIAIEPHDKVLGYDPEAPVAQAFIRGGIVGLRIAEVAMGQEYDRKLIETPVAIGQPNEEDDQQTQLHALGSALVDLGERGYAEAEPFHGWFEDREDHIWPDARQLAFAKRGFGVVMGLMKQAYEIEAAVSRQVQAELDADEILSSLGDDWADEFFNPKAE